MEHVAKRKIGKPCSGNGDAFRFFFDYFGDFLFLYNNITIKIEKKFKLEKHKGGR